MIAAGLGFKVAAVPFHLWAPDAYEGAPAPAAAFIASVSKVASFALLIGIGTAAAHMFGDVRAAMRHLVDRFPRYIGFGPTWSVIVTVLAVASMLLGNLAALAQISVRRLLAYSAIAHAGYILLALAYFSQSRERERDSVLHPHLRADDDRGIWRGRRGGAGDGQRSHGCVSRTAQAQSAACGGASGAVSVAGGDSAAGRVLGQVQFVCRGAERRGRAVPFALVALAVAMSAVSLYYYLQVLKRAYVMPAVDETPDRGQSTLPMMVLW